MSYRRTIGIDPGVTTGFVVITWDTDEPGDYHLEAGQLSRGLVLPLVRERFYPAHTWIAIERFVVSNRASRSSDSRAGEVTRGLIESINSVAGSRVAQAIDAKELPANVARGPRLFARSASEVKPWATDKRLAAAGLLDQLQGQRHARDAARHALFAMCHDLGAPDPLSQVNRVEIAP